MKVDERRNVEAIFSGKHMLPSSISVDMDGLPSTTKTGLYRGRFPRRFFEISRAAISVNKFEGLILKRKCEAR